MRNGDRLRAAIFALIAGGILFAGQASHAMRVEFRSDSVMTIADPINTGGTGFDNSSLMLTPDFDITNEWLSAGVPVGGETFAFQISETQTLRDATQQGLPGQELNVTDPWISTVEWTVTNNTGQEGPALLFFSGLREFADPTNPTVAASEQYLPSEVGILMTGDFSVARFVGQSGTYDYLAFYIEDFSQPVDITFEYEVTRDIIGFETDDFGTPILTMNGFLVPEPSASTLMVVGLFGLAYVGRRRNR
jgi:hypothetical protein